MKKWIGILCLVCVGAAHAENWQSLGGNDQAELSIDVDSIKESNGIREAWSMWNFKAPLPTSDIRLPMLQSYQNMYLYNCEEQTLKPTREVIFTENDGKGAKRDHSYALKNMQFSKPKPDSVADAMLQLVCRYKIPAAKK